MPVNAMAFCVTGAPLDARTIPESYVFLRDVATAPFGIQFGDPEKVADAVSPDRPVLLIENDGVLVLGTTVLDAFDRLEVLEATAEALINSRSIGPLHPMDDAAIRELVEAFFGPKKGGVSVDRARHARAGDARVTGTLPAFASRQPRGRE